MTEAVPGGGSVTLWTGKTELFMEYPGLIVGEERQFAIHLSRMDNFKPITRCSLELFFQAASGGTFTAQSPAPSSPGIYRPSVKFEQPGTYRLTMILRGEVKDTLEAESIPVYFSADSIPAEEEEASGEQLISFLKEQQWKIDFRTEPVRKRRISGSVAASGEIVPKLTAQAVVSAPFSGVLFAEQNRQIPLIGANVQKGDVLAVLSPSAQTPDGGENFAFRYAEAESESKLAQAEFDRAKRLYEKGAIPLKEYQEAEAAHKRALANFRALQKYVQREAGKTSAEITVQDDYGFVLKAPLSGTVAEVHVVPGKQVNAGDPLFRIVDVSTVWLRINVPVTEVGKLKNPSRASFRVAGFDRPFRVDEKNSRLVSFGNVVSEETRSIPLIFEIENDDRKLKVGMFADVQIAAGSVEGLAVPETALIEEEGRYSAFVHLEGETFAKRAVDIGAKDNGWMEIKHGLSAGERVVTRGAYDIRLASLSTQLPAHGHEH
ncbi:MAG TPA: efflux RND transporter periplasmic adaptor subunit [Verrucomicrobiae bacterium]|nr:efflux RND transporter periplasmic adaptor subunit [Verrucomicrobiae bacterium]